MSASHVHEADGVRTVPITARILFPALLFLSVFGVYAFSAEREAINTDAYAASAGAWRIATTGTPWLDGVDVQDLPGTHAPDLRGTWLNDASNGHVVAQRMAGPIMLGVPFYWVAQLWSDPSHFNIMPGGLAAAFATALAVLLVFLSLRRIIPTLHALATTLIFAFTTPTWSVSANGLWTHSITQLGIAGAIYSSTRQRWGLAGVFLGIGMFGRPHIAVIAAVLGLGVSWSRRSLLPAVFVALPTAAALGLLALWNRWVFGDWSIGGAYGDDRIAQAAGGYAGESSSAQWLNYVGFFVSFDRGFLIWSPLVAVLMLAVVRSWPDLPDWSKWTLLGGLLYTFFQLRLNYFAGGEGFHAYRHGLELLTCLVPVCALSMHRVALAGRFVAPLLIALQFVAFALGASVESYFVPLEDVWTDNAFWRVLRAQPMFVGMLLVPCMLGGLIAGFALLRRPRAAVRRPLMVEVP